MIPPTRCNLKEGDGISLKHGVYNIIYIFQRTCLKRKSTHAHTINNKLKMI
eukprot:m.136929 g.136929  ORF g.136929 m.136929 type:complete len:51 (-) comp13147_c4_seq10:873-1025(-)